jgi:hypothetical protein
MNTATTTAADTRPPVIDTATHILQALYYATIRDLPVPFSFSGTSRGHIILNFHSRDDVLAWAADMEVVLTTDAPNVRASGMALNVQLTVVAFVPEAVWS